MPRGPTQGLEFAAQTATAAGSDHVFTSVDLKLAKARRSLADVMWSVEEALAEWGGGVRSILKMIWFVPTRGVARGVRRTISAHFPDGCPPTTIFVQAPLGDADLSVLIWSVKASVPVSYPFPNSSLCAQDGVLWHFLGGVRPEAGSSFLERARDCYRQVDERLLRLSAAPSGPNHFTPLGQCGEVPGGDPTSRSASSHLVRTWIGIPDITGGPPELENYQALNLARREHFTRALPSQGARPAYPASTGIGTRDETLVLGLVGCHTTGCARVVPIENGSQTSAYHYQARYSAVPPLFSRGVAVSFADTSLVLVSGTASILGARTVHVGSIRRQAEQSLENVDHLLNAGNLAGAGLCWERGGLESLLYCVAYIKDRTQAACVRRVCERQLPPGVPTLYVEAEVCRDDLLVEVEGIAAPPQTEPARDQPQ